ncbi:DNA phosphorothioation-dependent restriction protein DptH [Aliikangiella sp. IMCC44359]|uniref:DNA phosphorothioation-dependent restriction protein DptH n=1 Tax=Aliikangiella sp. IMCC44359 TaxID=3459125 RepID=UPI00403B0539
MSKVPFEQFLVSLFCERIDESNLQETKFHYICSDPEQSKRLYSAFNAYNKGFKTVKVDEVDVHYVETNSSIKVLVMLHQNGVDARDTYNEDFIANVRDALNDIERAVLFVIHNSSLDTILTSCQSLSSNGQVFTPEYVYEKLTRLSQDHPYPQLMQVLNEKQREDVVEQNLSVFGFISLYESVVGKTVDFSKQGLFQDRRLFDIENKREILGDVKSNSYLHSKINSLVSSFSDNERELIERLESVGFGEKFIKNNFTAKNKENWKQLDYRAVEDELEKNKKRKLDLNSIEVDGIKQSLYKREGTSGAKYKRVTVLIEVDKGPLELKFRLDKGDPHLNSEQIRVLGDYQKHHVRLKVSNHENQSVITTQVNFDGTAKLFQFKLNRPSSAENYQFNCLLVQKESFSLNRVFEKLTVDFKRNKGQVLLENVTAPILLKPEVNNELVVDSDNLVVNLSEYGSINFGPYLKTEVASKVVLKYLSDSLPIRVVGKVTLDAIKLPSILDKNRTKDIHTSEDIAKYNGNTQRAIVSGKEKELSVGAKVLCRVEKKFVNDEILFIDEFAGAEISLQDISTDFPSVANAYRELLNWLRTNETIISLTNWPTNLKNIVNSLLGSFVKELESIPDGSLSERHKNLLKVGVFYGSFDKGEQPTDWLTPYHPISLAYAHQLVMKLEKSESSIDELPGTTLDKLNPAGLLPIIYDNNFDYAFSIAHPQNRLWLQIVPQKKSNLSFVAKLVYEKINDFLSCFEMLFRDNKASPLVINSIHNQSNKFIFEGVVAYFRKQKNKAMRIHVHLCDDRLHESYFDNFAEARDLSTQRRLIRNSEREKTDITDELLAILREKLTYSKSTGPLRNNYAHISFFKNNEKVEIKDKQVLNAKSGLSCQGLIAGEASYLENNNYYTGFGLKGINDKNYLINIAEKYNSLLKPMKDASASYIKGVVPVLAVKDSFKEQLKISYDNSIWTCVIDPKVTLDFFDDKNTILVHYSDQYTNSVAYDAITVSSRISLYRGLLKESADELINSFNAVSGQWLLDIIKAAGKPQSKANEKHLKEKQGIVAAYKLLASFFLKSDIIWVPLSIAELIRVTGNVGLKIKESDFSVRLQNKKVGAMSDDLLFVGVKDGAMYLLPLEVKTREKGNDFSKAIKQAYELSNHMGHLLTSDCFKGQLYRSLFIQHVMSQVERFKLYKVFPEGYFDRLVEEREFYQQGTYDVLALENYVLGIVIAFNNSKETSRLSVNVDGNSNILTIEVPFGLMKALQSQDLKTLSEKLTNTTDRPELAPYILTNTNGKALEFENLDIEHIGDEPVEKRLDQTIEQNVEPEQSESVLENRALDSSPFEHPKEFDEFIRLLLSKITHKVSKEYILALSEGNIKRIIGNDGKLLLDFFRLKEWLTHQSVSNLKPVKDNLVLKNKNGVLLKDLFITQEFQALSKFIRSAFGDEISVSKVVSLDEYDLLAQDGFGRAKLAKFEKFREHLENNAFSISTTSQDKQIIEDIDISLPELERELANSLDNYLANSSEREKTIFIRRLGLGCESCTLEEIGQDYDITRERIRQIEKKAKQNFLAYLTVSQNVVKALTQANLSELREPLFSNLRKKFFADKQFYLFLELCCGLGENEIRRITSPEISRDIFNEFWISHKSPCSLEDLTWFLHENLNIEIAVAENQVLCWKSEGDLKFEEELVSPLKLPKVEAITNTLLEFPLGESWANIQKRAIEKKICTAVVSTERLEASLMTACDREYIYQNGRGSYRHLCYLDLNDQDIQYVLEVVKGKLQEYAYENRDSVNLAVDIYDQYKFALDYFEVRYVVRTYGETNGIFFKGKSNADTVSLNSNFNLASQKSVLADLFKNSLLPLSKNKVANKIRSKSLGHAAFYIDKLLAEGIIVRVDEKHFAHVKNAFKKLDVERIMEQAKIFLQREHRIVEGESLQTFINRKLALELNKYLYLSLLRIHGEDVGLKLYFVQNLVSKNEIVGSGLAEFCREALDGAASNLQAIELLKEKICVHDHVIKRCINQVSAKRAGELTQRKESVESMEQTNKIDDCGADQSANASLDMIESCRVLIGQSLDTSENIYWEYGNKQLANRHLIVFGRSGQGKTYCIQGILMEMAKTQYNSLVIDYTNGFLPNHLEHEFNSTLNPESHFLAQQPMGISPFRKQKQDFGGVTLEEKGHVVAARIASVFNQVYSSIGEQQLATLINVIEDGVSRHGANYDFSCMLDDLREEGKIGEALANKLSPMVKSKLFDNSNSQGWHRIFKDAKSKVNIVQLASLSRDIMQLATEFTLWDLYAFACSYGQKNRPLPIVLDEVQNLDHRLESPLGKMLTEGRKYGFSLILATQTLSMMAKEEQDRLFQASHKLFFAPAETEIQSYAKLLEQAIPGSNKKAWLEELAKLKKGECISIGLHKDFNGNLEQSARTIKVAELKSRIINPQNRE